MLRRQGTSCSARPGGGIIYRASPKACTACPLREACCGTTRARTITRPDDGGLYDRTRAYLRTARRAEHPAAEVLGRDRHDRVQRGPPAAARPVSRPGQGALQAFSAAIAYNIKKFGPLARPMAPGPRPGTPTRRAAPGRSPPRSPQAEPPRPSPLPAVQPELVSATGPSRAVWEMSRTRDGREMSDRSGGAVAASAGPTDADPCAALFGHDPYPNGRTGAGGEGQARALAATDG